MTQWWAEVGVVACHWSAGEDSEAESYYATIESMLGDRYVLSLSLFFSLSLSPSYYIW